MLIQGLIYSPSTFRKFWKKNKHLLVQLRYDVSGKYLDFNFWRFFIEPTPFRSYIGYILFYYLYEVPTYYLEKCKKNPLPTLGQRQFFYKTNIKCKGCLLFGSTLINFWVLCSIKKNDKILMEIIFENSQSLNWDHKMCNFH